MKFKNDVKLRGKYADTVKKLADLKKKRNECLVGGNIVEARNLQKNVVQITKELAEIDRVLFC